MSSFKFDGSKYNIATVTWKHMYLYLYYTTSRASTPIPDPCMCCKDELEVADREVVICKGAKCQLTALVSVVDGASSAG